MDRWTDDACLLPFVRSRARRALVVRRRPPRRSARPRGTMPTSSSRHRPSRPRCRSPLAHNVVLPALLTRFARSLALQGQGSRPDALDPRAHPAPRPRRRPCRQPVLARLARRGRRNPAGDRQEGGRRRRRRARGRHLRVGGRVRHPAFVFFLLQAALPFLTADSPSSCDRPLRERSTSLVTPQPSREFVRLPTSQTNKRQRAARRLTSVSLPPSLPPSALRRASTKTDGWRPLPRT